VSSVPVIIIYKSPPDLDSKGAVSLCLGHIVTHNDEHKSHKHRTNSANVHFKTEHYRNEDRINVERDGGNNEKDYVFYLFILLYWINVSREDQETCVQ
jgi:hypothetical protein